MADASYARDDSLTLAYSRKGLTCASEESKQTALETLVRNHTNFNYVCFSNVKLTTMECIIIRNVLNNNATIVEMNLRRCNINSQGAILIAHGLIHNKTLRSLDLSRNLIAHEGMVYLYYAVCINSTLLSLDLRMHVTVVQTEFINAIQRKLEQNKEDCLEVQGSVFNRMHLWIIGKSISAKDKCEFLGDLLGLDPLVVAEDVEKENQLISRIETGTGSIFDESFSAPVWYPELGGSEGVESSFLTNEMDAGPFCAEIASCDKWHVEFRLETPDLWERKANPRLGFHSTHRASRRSAQRRSNRRANLPRQRYIFVFPETKVSSRKGSDEFSETDSKLTFKSQRSNRRYSATKGSRFTVKRREGIFQGAFPYTRKSRGRVALSRPREIRIGRDLNPNILSMPRSLGNLAPDLTLHPSLSFQQSEAESELNFNRRRQITSGGRGKIGYNAAARMGLIDSDKFKQTVKRTDGKPCVRCDLREERGVEFSRDNIEAKEYLSNATNFLKQVFSFTRPKSGLPDVRIPKNLEEESLNDEDKLQAAWSSFSTEKANITAAIIDTEPCMKNVVSRVLPYQGVFVYVVSMTQLLLSKGDFQRELEEHAFTLLLSRPECRMALVLKAHINENPLGERDVSLVKTLLQKVNVWIEERFPFFKDKLLRYKNGSFLYFQPERTTSTYTHSVFKSAIKECYVEQMANEDVIDSSWPSMFFRLHNKMFLRDSLGCGNLNEITKDLTSLGSLEAEIPNMLEFFSSRGWLHFVPGTSFLYLSTQQLFAHIVRLVHPEKRFLEWHDFSEACKSRRLESEVYRLRTSGVISPDLLELFYDVFDRESLSRISPKNCVQLLLHYGAIQSWDIKKLLLMKPRNATSLKNAQVKKFKKMFQVFFESELYIIPSLLPGSKWRKDFIFREACRGACKKEDVEEHHECSPFYACEIRLPDYILDTTQFHEIIAYIIPYLADSIDMESLMDSSLYRALRQLIASGDLKSARSLEEKKIKKAKRTIVGGNKNLMDVRVEKRTKGVIGERGSADRASSASSLGQMALRTLRNIFVSNPKNPKVITDSSAESVTKFTPVSKPRKKLIERKKSKQRANIFQLSSYGIIPFQKGIRIFAGSKDEVTLGFNLVVDDRTERCHTAIKAYVRNGSNASKILKALEDAIATVSASSRSLVPTASLHSYFPPRTFSQDKLFRFTTCSLVQKDVHREGMFIASATAMNLVPLLARKLSRNTDRASLQRLLTIFSSLVERQKGQRKQGQRMEEVNVESLRKILGYLEVWFTLDNTLSMGDIEDGMERLMMSI